MSILPKKNGNILSPRPCATTHPSFTSTQKTEVITCAEKRRRHGRARLLACASGNGVDYDGSFAGSYACTSFSSTALRLSADIRKDGRQAAIFCNFVCIVV